MFEKKQIGLQIKRLARGGFFHVLCGNTLVKMIAFVSSIIIVRLVDKTAYAHLAYADNLYNYVNAFAGLGMSSAILKFCAVAKNREEDLAYFHFGLKYGTLVQFSLSMVVVIYSFVGDIPFPEARPLIYLLCLYPSVTNIIAVFMSYARAHGENKLYANIAIIQTVIIFIASVGFVFLVGVNGIAYARYLAILITIIIAYTCLTNKIKGSNKVGLNVEQKKNFLRLSFSMMLSSVFTLIIPINEMTLVNQIIKNEIVTANYKVAIMIPGQITFITQSIIIYYFTIVAKMDKGKDIWKLAKKVTAGTTILIASISLVGILISPILIKTVYGSQYNDAAILSNFFWVVYGINASIRMIPLDFILALGVAKFNVFIAGISCAVHLVLAYFMIMNFGIIGAALATGIIYIFSAMALWIYLKRQCRLMDQ